MTRTLSGPPDVAETEATMPAYYVYGIVPAGTSVEGLEGGLGGGLDLLVDGPVGAVVEQVDPTRPLGRRRDLVSHSSVVNGLAEAGPVLPMRFGAVVDGREAVVEELLHPQQEHFSALLDRVTGKVQLTVRMRYDLDAVLAEVVSADREIADLRRRVAELPEDTAHQAKIRLGELVAHALDARREDDGRQVLDRLAPLAEDVVVKEVSGMDGAFEAAFLVARGAQREFEEAAELLAEEWHGRARVSLVGPMALYDFVGEL